MKKNRKMESFQDLLEEAKRRTILWTIFVLGLAYLLSLSSNYVLFNLPVAVLILAAIRYMSFELEIRRRVESKEIPLQLAHLLKHQLSSKDPRLKCAQVSRRWRRKIDSTLVEVSIGNFTHSIVKEFVTDLWFSSLSSDQDVPLQIEALINDMFGEIALRVKQINLIELLTRDLVDLVSNHLELFRQTKASIGVKVFERLSTEEREDRLKSVLKITNKLHPALFSSESEYKVLRQFASQVVAILLRSQDSQCAILRGLVRELLACAVFRPIMNFANPSVINKAIEQAIAKGKLQTSNSERIASDGSSNGKSSKGGSSRENQNEQNQDNSRIAVSSTDSAVKPGDWAQALDAMNKRRTTTLAPENLDNLWAKGRNYKKRELEKASGKPSQHQSVHDKHNLKLSNNGSGIPGADAKYGIHYQSIEPFKIEKRHDYNAGQGSSWQGEQVSVENLVAGSQYPLSISAEGGQKVKKTHLNYWDNPGIQLSAGSTHPEQDADWVNDVNAIGGKSMDHLSSKLNCWVVGAHLEKIGTNTFAVYSIAVTDSLNNTWFVERRFRNFEQLHRNLRDLPQYNLQLPPKRILSSNLDDAFVRDRCILLDKYLKDLLSIPSVAELHEVWDFLSVTSKKYSFTKSSSVMKTIAVNVDDAVDDMVRQLKGVSDGIFRQLGAPPSPPRDAKDGHPSNVGDMLNKAVSSPSGSYLTYSEKEKLEQFSDDGSVEVPEEEVSHLGDGWHSDSEVQDRNSIQQHVSENDKNEYRMEKRIKRVGSGSVQEGSVGGLEPVEEDPDVPPPEWTPPKLTIPLLNLVDGIFQLQQRGWLRRQVFWMAKQILQLGMGDAMDDWLVSQVQLLRREDIVASSINWVQGILWPGGIFITKVKKEEDLSLSKQSTQKGSAFFESQLEASRCAQVVYEALVEGGPAALVSLVGKKQYTRCAKDVYYFLQSTVFIKQLTYSVLETLLIVIFPELRHLILDIRKQGKEI